LIYLAFSEFGRTELFTYHPVLMITAFLFLMTQGIVAYKTDYGIKFLEDRAAKRNFHRGVQIAALLLALSGSAVIVTTKMIEKESLVPKSLHSLFGASTLLLVVMQAIFGWLKYIKLTNDGIRVWKFHISFGVPLYILGIVTLNLGAAEAFSGFALTICYVFSALLAVTILVKFYVIPRFQQSGLPYQKM